MSKNRKTQINAHLNPEEILISSLDCGFLWKPELLLNHSAYLKLTKGAFT